jgi:hypothetical protein
VCAQHVQGEQQELEVEHQDNFETISSTESQVDGDSTTMGGGQMDLPIALRKGTRACVERLQKRHDECDIGNFVSYEAFSPSYKAFVASLYLFQQAMASGHVGRATSIEKKRNLGVSISSNRKKGCQLSKMHKERLKDTRQNLWEEGKPRPMASIMMRPLHQWRR